MCYSQVDLTLCVMDWEGQNERKVRGEALMEREDPGMLWKWYSWLLLYLVRGWGGNSRQVWWWWLFIWLWWFISPNLDCQCSEIKEYKFSLYLAKIELVHSRKIFKSSGFYSFFFLFWTAPHSMWDLSSSPGIEYVPPAVEERNLNRWTTREVPSGFYSWWITPIYSLIN